MPDEKTPFEKLSDANDDYHEAFNEVLMDEVLPVDIKAKFGAFHNNIFQHMTEAKHLIALFYSEEV